MRKKHISNRVCRNCGQLYRPKPYRARRSRFCSSRCRGSVTPQRKFDQGPKHQHGTCLLWGGHVNDGGYGFVISGGRRHMAHRLAYEAHTKKQIPSGLNVLHHCDVRACINPHHLFLGTDRDNVADMDRKGCRTVLRGSANSRSKLTEAIVRRIRATKHKRGHTTKLANKYGVSVGLISLVLKRKVWRHV